MSLPTRPLIFVACGFAGFLSARAFILDASNGTINLARAASATASLKPLVGVPEESAMVAEWEQLRRDHGGEAADFQALYATVKDTKDPYRRRVFRAALLADWAVRDPQAGLAYLLEKDAGNATQLMRECMRRDPDAAITGILAAGGKAQNALRGLQSEIARLSPGRLAEVANALPKAENRWDTATQDAFAIAAENDPAAARAAADLVTGSLRGQALAGVATTWAEKDGGAALAWAEAMPSGEVRDAALKGALIGWARTDPVAALNKIDLVPPGGDENLHASDVGAQVLREAAGRNWDTTLQWLVDNPGKLGSESLNGMQSVLTQRLLKEPAGTVREIGATGVPGLERVFSNAILNDGYVARDAILAWLDVEPPSEFNNRIRGNLLKTIASKEPAVALEFFERLPETVENKELCALGAGTMLNNGRNMHLLDTLLENASSKMRPHLLQAGFLLGSAHFAARPGLWLSRVDELPENLRLNAMNSVVRGWAAADPEAALEWATKLPDASQRDVALTSATGVWAQADPRGAAGWIDALPRGASRDRAAHSLVQALSGKEPEAAWAWASSIEAEDLRVSALQCVYQTMRRKDAATAEEMLHTTNLTPAEIESLRAGPGLTPPARAGTPFPTP